MLVSLLYQGSEAEGKGTYLDPSTELHRALYLSLVEGMKLEEPGAVDVQPGYAVCVEKVA